MPLDTNRPDYTLYTGQWDIGRTYETRGGSDSLRWFWSMTVNPPMTHSDRVATLEEAKAQFPRAGTGGRLGRTWRSEVRRLEHRGAVAFAFMAAALIAALLIAAWRYLV
jgi:hypothetical protein